MIPVIARMQYDERKPMVSDISFEGDKGVTKQSDSKDCDINLLMKRFERTGQLPDMIQKNPAYGDYSAVPDYQEALDIVRHADEQFINLDAHVRNRFDNDPAKFLAFANDPANQKELAKMGLLNAEATKRLDDAEKLLIAQNKANEDALKAASEKALIEKVKAELGK